MREGGEGEGQVVGVLSRCAERWCCDVVHVMQPYVKGDLDMLTYHGAGLPLR